jgi:hypothetical protein
MSIVSLVIAPTLAHNFATKINNERQEKMQSLINLQNTSLKEQSNQNKNLWVLTTPPEADRNAVEKEIKSFIDVLEEDNLIKANTFSVAVAKGELYIDGEKQPASVIEKYRNNIEKTGDFIAKEPAK